MTDEIHFCSKLPSFDVGIMAMGQKAFDGGIRLLQNMSHKTQASTSANADIQRDNEVKAALTSSSRTEAC